MIQSEHNTERQEKEGRTQPGRKRHKERKRVTDKQEVRDGGEGGREGETPFRSRFTMTSCEDDKRFHS